ncbi:SLATT domain-containing protein [Knoellia locipacati]|uniref:SMODS and SLOG-associating 2TM effector domain-containing protein n=1 Tax=Knoellia locipacati TaxID=882824 RepID=A0A512T4T7_9MICO|nr:SLATT domain-containing protein [Knoellia locipacati]GEQ15230.1 hypothetical protein KLO01_32770 [Knoellia locipacati]
MPSVPDAVLRETKETFGRVAYTHKTHEKQAELKQASAWRIRVANVVVIGLAAGAALIAPLIRSSPAAWLAFVAGLVGFVFTVLQLSFDPASEASSHQLAAKSYLVLRNEYRRLIADAEVGDQGIDELRARRDALARELSHLERAAPPTSAKAYMLAREALRGAEELSFTQDEYRHLLGPDDRA